MSNELFLKRCVSSGSLSVGSFSYTSHVGFIFIWGVSLTHPVLASFLFGGVSLTHPVLASFFLSGEFLLLIPCWLHFHLGSFSYISRAFFAFFLLIPCWLHFYQGNFSYTSRAGFIFIWGVSLTHPMLVSLLSDTFRAGCIFIWGVSLTHPVLAFFDVRSFFPLQCTLKKIL